MNIRPATEEDQPTIRRLIKDANLNRMSLHWRNFVVADENGAIVGVGQVKVHRNYSRELARGQATPRRRSRRCSPHQSFKVDAAGMITTSSGGTSHIVAANIKAANGVIHVIDTVLMPAS